MNGVDLVGVGGEDGDWVEDGGYLYEYSVITNQHMLYGDFLLSVAEFYVDNKEGSCMERLPIINHGYSDRAETC